MGGHKFVGIVKVFNSEKGWGFIECDQAYDVFGQDVFLLHSHFAGDTCGKGVEVCFSVAHGSRGPEAMDVRVASDADRNTIRKLQAERAALVEAAPAEGWAYAEARQEEAVGPSLSAKHTEEGKAEYYGQVKLWNALKGYGMIACPDTFAIHGKDMFFMKTAVQGSGIQVGSEVSFSVQKGLKGPEGAFIQILSGANPDVVEDWSDSKASQAQTAAQPSASTSCERGVIEFSGQVKLWNPSKGYGMIACPDTFAIHGKDMFFMKSAVSAGSIQVGAQVSFTVQTGLKGSEGASVRVLSGGATYGDAVLDSAKSTPYYGTVKSFFEDKGWGHIACDATQQLYGKDMFLLGTRLNGQHVKPGDEVMFHVVMGVKGAEAADVTILSGEYVATGSYAAPGDARASPY